jgi:hypothetical protein
LLPVRAQTVGVAKGGTTMNVLRVSKAVAGPGAVLAGLGFTYAAAECATEHYRGKADSVSGVVAGLATGGCTRRPLLARPPRRRPRPCRPTVPGASAWGAGAAQPQRKLRRIVLLLLHLRSPAPLQAPWPAC